jgi:hypothetical protein
MKTVLSVAYPGDMAIDSMGRFGRPVKTVYVKPPFVDIIGRYSPTGSGIVTAPVFTKTVPSF